MSEPFDLRAIAAGLERRFDRWRLRRREGFPPRYLRIVPYVGHGHDRTAMVRGRVLDNPAPPEATEGERGIDAFRRTLRRFNTVELPDVPLSISLGVGKETTVSDAEGYFVIRLELAAQMNPGWHSGVISLDGDYRGLTARHETEVQALFTGPNADFGVISDVDDTILDTGAQRAWTVLKNTFTGSALTRLPLVGAAELYRALHVSAGGDENPVFYVSSSPWNLHGFLEGFIRHQQFPLGPILLRDLLGESSPHSHHEHKGAMIDEILDVHPHLSFVLIGDSGQDDPSIYAEAVRRNPGRILAVYIRETRLDTGEGRVEQVSQAWDHDVPLLLTPDSAAMAEHAAGLGLIDLDAVAAVRGAVEDG